MKGMNTTYKDWHIKNEWHQFEFNAWFEDVLIKLTKYPDGKLLSINIKKLGIINHQSPLNFDNQSLPIYFCPMSPKMNASLPLSLFGFQVDFLQNNFNLLQWEESSQSTFNIMMASWMTLLKITSIAWLKWASF